MTLHQHLSLPFPQTLEFYETTETKIIPWNLWSCCTTLFPFLQKRKRGHKIPEMKCVISNTSLRWLLPLLLHTDSLNKGLGSNNIQQKVQRHLISIMFFKLDTEYNVALSKSATKISWILTRNRGRRPM